MTQINLLSELNSIASEGRNLNTLDIDTLPTLAILEKINQEDHKVAAAVSTAMADITLGVEAIVSSFNRGGRLVYMGAGTSGRLGILDAVECMPTFSVPEGMVIGLIAGGELANGHAVDGVAEGFGLEHADAPARIAVLPGAHIGGVTVARGQHHPRESTAPRDNGRRARERLAVGIRETTQVRAVDGRA